VKVVGHGGVRSWLYVQWLDIGRCVVCRRLEIG
jgi:hypothetical protein